jgi:hypothetical protein
MKRAAVALAALAALAAQAQDGFFRVQTKAGETCSFSMSWGRGMLNNLTLSPATPASCQSEALAAADALAKTPPQQPWDRIAAAPPQANGQCVMTLSWPQGSPGAVSPTLATRLGGINGTPLATEPGCSADAREVADWIVHLGGVAPAKAVRLKLKWVPLNDEVE